MRAPSGRGVVVVAALAAALLACGKDEPKRSSPTPVASPSAAAGAHADAAPSLPPPLPTTPRITVDGRGCTIDDKDFPGPPEAWKDGVAELLGGKAHVAGEVVPVLVSPGARMPRVEAIVSALEQSKAKGVSIRSRARSGSDGEVSLAFRDPSQPACVTMTIEADHIVKLSGAEGHPETIPRGDRGLDPERVSQALRRRLAACGSRPWTLSVADTIPWAGPFEVLVDLMGPGSGGDAHAAAPALVPFVKPDGGSPRAR